MAEQEIEKDSPDAELLEEAKERFDACLEYYGEEYRRGREDVNFLLGDQWDEDIRAKRQTEGRPCLTENRLLAFAHQVINDIRQSRPSINVIPVDDNADIETARVLRGLIRNTEVQSGADSVYDTAAWNAISAGYGWIRVNTKYSDDTSFDQEAELLRVPDFASVMLDPNAKKMDGSDAEFGFVTEDIARDNFKALYPDFEDLSWADSHQQDGWCSENTIRVCEYFYKEYEKKTIYLLDDGSVVDELPEGQTPVMKREVRIPSVKWCKFNANEVLEKTDWLGIYIPLVPTYGEEVWQDGRRKSFSLITQGKDPQRRYNYWLTASTELIALQPKAPFVGLAGQFKTSASKWAMANNQSYAYLEYDAVKMPDGTWHVAAPQRQSPPMGSPAMFQEMMAAADGIKSSLGIFDRSLGAGGNETSGKAIMAVQKEGDNATFHIVDNLQFSIRHVGRILIDLEPKLIDGPRTKRIIGDDDSRMVVPLNQPVMNMGKEGYRPVQAGEKPDTRFDLNTGKYDVIATVGASYQTKRQETRETLIALMQSNPETFNLFGDIFLKNLDIPEAEMMAERMRRANPAMQDEKDPQEAAMMQAQQQMQAMQAQMQQMDEALKAKKQKEDAETQAEIAKTNAEIEKIKAETTKVQAEVAAAMATTGGMTPEHLHEIVSTIAQLEAQTADTAHAVDLILSHHEASEPQQEIQPEAPQAPMVDEAPVLPA